MKNVQNKMKRRYKAVKWPYGTNRYVKAKHSNKGAAIK